MKKKRVLLVEDDQNVALVIKDGLADLDAASEIEIVTSDEEALQRMAHRVLIETLKTLSPATRTILTTAYDTAKLEQAAQRLNVYQYMTKPFLLGDLKRVVQSALAS